MPFSSSLDKDQIKVVIDKVTQWLDLAEEGDQMTLPGISGRQGRRLFLRTWEHGGCHGNVAEGGEQILFPVSPDPKCPARD